MKKLGRVKIWDDNGLTMLDIKELDEKKLKKSIKEVLKFKL